tara:strand:+ start:924 stop:1328 length:405 start_codon:yes stop_codon:yes gene_type:complete
MPYLLLLDDDGIVQYRIDKAERGNARKVKFDVLKVDGTGAYCRKSVVEHVDTVAGIKAAKAVADILSRRALLKDTLEKLGVSCKRSELIELIEQVDQIHVGSTTIITELIEWLHPDTIATFIEDAKTALEIDHA